MAIRTRDDIRNLAVIAHVDHGKTTLTDSLLWQSEVLRESESALQRMVESMDLEREKAISVMAKNTAVLHKGVRVNLVDAPGRSDFGGDVERTLKMVEGVLLIVDACEGPVPQTRFVLRRALEEGLAPIVVLNKIDLPDSRVPDVQKEIREMFVDLDSTEAQIDCPVLFCNALKGVCRTEPEGEDKSLVTLLDRILETIPAPEYDPDGPSQFLVTDLDYDDYLGRLAIGRVFGGVFRRGQEVAHCRLDGTTVPARLTAIYGYEGLHRVEVEEARPGDIVALTGVEWSHIGSTVSGARNPRPLPPINVGEPTISVVVSVSDSPLVGLEGQFVEGRNLRERLWQEILTNPWIRVEETDSPDAFRLWGRGELQLAILLEMMRREGFEMSVGRPEVMTREIDGVKHEPMELLVLDLPEDHAGVVREKAEARSGKTTRMVNHGTGRVRMEFRIPSRRLIGFRTEFINDTRGTGIMTQIFDGYGSCHEEPPVRSRGVLVADRPGRATAHAIGHLQPRGTMFVAPGDEVYEGMIVGENSRANDIAVDITKEKKPIGPVGATAPEPSPRLIPPRTLSLEQALEFIRDEELVEVTPRALRIRKKVLKAGGGPRKS